MNQFFRFNFFLSPNSDGQLEGGAALDALWWRYLQSGFSFRSESFNLVTRDGSNRATVASTANSYVFDVVKTRDNILQDLLGAIFNAKVDFIGLNAGAIVKIMDDAIGETGIVYGTNAPYFYQDDKRVFYVKPMWHADACLYLPFIELSGYIEDTPLDVTEYTYGSVLYSTDFSQQAYNINDAGFDTRYGGGLKVKIESETERFSLFNFNADYFRHIGYFQKYSSDGQWTKYVYETYDLAFTVSWEMDFVKNIMKALKINMQVPVVGVSYIIHTFNPVQIFGVAGYTNTRYKLELGLKM